VNLYSLLVAPTCFSAVTPPSVSALFVVAKVTFVKIVNYGTSVCDYYVGHVVAYIGSVLVGVCMLHCLGGGGGCIRKVG
jgi:hypothetical protein